VATNAQIIATARRLVAEGTASEWDASVMQAHVNAAYIRAQARWREVKRDAFLAGADADVVATQARYLVPTEENIDHYEWLRSDGSGVYDELPLLMRAQQQHLLGGPWKQTRCHFAYYPEGQEIVIVPTPTVSVTAGLGVIYVEVVEMSAPGDIPRLPAALHSVLPYGAAISAIEESKDAAESTVDRWRARWASIFGPWEASTPDSRKALRLLCQLNQNRSLDGLNLAQI